MCKGVNISEVLSLINQSLFVSSQFTTINHLVTPGDKNLPVNRKKPRAEPSRQYEIFYFIFNNPGNIVCLVVRKSLNKISRCIMGNEGASVHVRISRDLQ